MVVILPYRKLKIIPSFTCVFIIKFRSSCQNLVIIRNIPLYLQLFYQNRYLLIINVEIMYARRYKMAPGISRHRRDPNITFSLS